jgi:hypothetical protein
MKLEKNEYTTDSLIAYLEKKYGKKITDEPFNKNDVSQYLQRGMIPYRYGGQKISSKKQDGVRIITIEK